MRTHNRINRQIWILQAPCRAQDVCLSLAWTCTDDVSIFLEDFMDATIFCRLIIYLTHKFSTNTPQEISPSYPIVPCDTHQKAGCQNAGEVWLLSLLHGWMLDESRRKWHDMNRIWIKCMTCWQSLPGFSNCKIRQTGRISVELGSDNKWSLCCQFVSDDNSSSSCMLQF